MARRQNTADGGLHARAGDPPIERAGAWVYLIVGAGCLGGLVVVACVIIAKLGDAGSGRFEFALPVLLVLGVGGVTLMIAALIPIYRRAGLASPDHALGLPQGSVRALISLFFIIMFLIASVFLATQMRGSSELIDNVSAEQRDELLTDDRLERADPVPDSDPVRYDVWVRVEPAEAQVQFADRMFVTLSTLITALAAFYFGERAVAAAKADVTGDSTLRLIVPDVDDPPDLPPDGGVLDGGVQLAFLPLGARVNATASSGTLLQNSAQPERFEFRVGVAESATLTFALSDFPTCPAVTLQLSRPARNDAPPAPPPVASAPAVAPPAG